MSKKRILVVEDDREFAEILKARLENANFGVLVADNGEKGINVARREKPDLIIMDVFLPQKDGFTAMKELKSSKKILGPGEHETRDIPVIVITGRTPMMEDMFRIEGAIDFLNKPVDIKALIEKIQKAIGKSDD